MTAIKRIYTKIEVSGHFATELNDAGEGPKWL